MARAVDRLALAVAVALISVYAALTVSLPLGVSDYHADGGPEIAALDRLDLHAFLSMHPLMGTFGLLLRAPFAAVSKLGSATELLAYRWGLLPCLMALVIFAVALLDRMSAARRSLWARGVLVAVLVLQPLSGRAIAFGHPEEILAGVLVVGAVLLASRQRPLAAGLALGLALATKQWAIIAVLPVLAAAPARRSRLALVAGAVAALLTLPGLLADSAGFVTLHGGALNASSWVGPPNVWWLVSHATHRAAFDGVGIASVTRYVLPAALNPLVRPLLILVCLALGAALLARRRRPSVDQVLCLLSLIFVVRCALDPWNNSYYAVPLLLALVARDAVAFAGLPLASPLAACALWLTLIRVPVVASAAAWNASFLAFCVLLAGWLSVRAFAPRRLEGLGRTHHARRLADPGPVAG